jgi:hypothetical protein
MAGVVTGTYRYRTYLSEAVPNRLRPWFRLIRLTRFLRSFRNNIISSLFFNSKFRESSH